MEQLLSVLSKNKPAGYLGVVSVLIIAIISLAVVIGVTILGNNELFYGYQFDQSNQALQLADACAEEAYLRLKLDASYTGGALSFTNGECEVSVMGIGTSRTLTAEAVVGAATRTLELEVDLLANADATAEGIDLTQWKE